MHVKQVYTFSSALYSSTDGRGQRKSMSWSSSVVTVVMADAFLCMNREATWGGHELGMKP